MKIKRSLRDAHRNAQKLIRSGKANIPCLVWNEKHNQVLAVCIDRTRAIKWLESNPEALGCELQDKQMEI